MCAETFCQPRPTPVPCCTLIKWTLATGSPWWREVYQQQSQTLNKKALTVCIDYCLITPVAGSSLIETVSSVKSQESPHISTRLSNEASESNAPVVNVSFDLKIHKSVLWRRQSSCWPLLAPGRPLMSQHWLEDGRDGLGVKNGLGLWSRLAHQNVHRIGYSTTAALLMNARSLQTGPPSNTTTYSSIDHYGGRLLP